MENSRIVSVVSVHAAINGDYRSRQVLAAVFTDVMASAMDSTDAPCMTACISSLSVLFRDAAHAYNENDDARLRREIRILRGMCSDIFRRCINYLSSPHTEAQMMHARSTGGLRSCRCERNNVTFLDDLHKVNRPLLHTPAPNEPRVETFLSTLAKVITLFFSTVDTVGGLCQIFRHAEGVLHKGGRPIWPTTSTDLCPLGMQTSVANICNWVKHCPTVELVHLAQDVWFLFGQFRNYATLLHDIIPNAVVPLLKRVLERYGRGLGHDTWTVYALDVAKGCTGFAAKMSEERWMALLANYTHPERFQQVVDILIRVSAITVDIPRNTSENMHMSGSFSACATGFKKHLNLHNMAISSMQLEDVISESSKLYRGFGCLADFIPLLHPGCHTNECGNLGCKVTKISRGGHNLCLCTGCACIFYLGE